MATGRESMVVNAAGVVQGVVQVTFPAASTIFTDPSRYDLSSSQYGALFLPQVIGAILASLLGADLGSRIGTKRVYLAGLAAGLLSMTLLIVSSLVSSSHGTAYVLLLCATGSLGVGFGLAVPAMNTLAAEFHPATVDRAILVLNALLGVGTVLAPVFVAIFVGLGFWQGLPIIAAILLATLFAVSVPLPLRVQPAKSSTPQAGTGVPSRFWVYAVFVVLYGICETVNGNWSQLDMTRELGASTAVASLALAVFWAMVTVGRVVFASVARRLKPRLVYHALPFVLAGAFVIVAALPRGAIVPGLLAFGLAGIGCSALLPLTISFGEADLAAISAAMAGYVIAFYQFGYGIAAFGVGPLQGAGVSLSAIFGFTACIAAAMALLSFFVAHRRPEPAGLPSAESGPPRTAGTTGPLQSNPQ